MAELRRLFHILLTYACYILSCHATDSGQLRLKGMHNGEGIIEIRHGHHWGLICASEWTMSAGEVACRQLGYEGVTRVMRVTPGNENLDRHVVFNGTDCRGNESRLIECTHSGFGNFTEQCHPLKLPWVSCIGAEGSVVGNADEVEEDGSNSVPMSGRVLSTSTSKFHFHLFLLPHLFCSSVCIFFPLKPRQFIGHRNIMAHVVTLIEHVNGWSEYPSALHCHTQVLGTCAVSSSGMIDSPRVS